MVPNNEYPAAPGGFPIKKKKSILQLGPHLIINLLKESNFHLPPLSSGEWGCNPICPTPKSSTLGQPTKIFLKWRGIWSYKVGSLGHFQCSGMHRNAHPQTTKRKSRTRNHTSLKGQVDLCNLFCQAHHQRRGNVSNLEVDESSVKLQKLSRIM
jgi:hypothetical protein